VNDEQAAPVIGVLGGTFDPVHRGHLSMAETALRVLGLERVLLLPTAIPPHKTVPHLTAGPHRAAMLRLALEGRDGLELCTLELDTGRVCYTIDTLRRLRMGPPPSRPVFVLGADSLVEIETWREHEALRREFDLAVIDRPGSPLGDGRLLLADASVTPIIDLSAEPGLHGGRSMVSPGTGGRIFRLPMDPDPVSSSEVRRAAAAGGDLADLVPAAVARYIRANRLYEKEEPH
jgi:nicotinate-nucleotide adenylyltransferase